MLRRKADLAFRTTELGQGSPIFNGKLPRPQRTDFCTRAHGRKQVSHGYDAGRLQPPAIPAGGTQDSFPLLKPRLGGDSSHEA